MATLRHWTKAGLHRNAFWMPRKVEASQTQKTKEAETKHARLARRPAKLCRAQSESMLTEVR